MSNRTVAARVLAALAAALLIASCEKGGEPDAHEDAEATAAAPSRVQRADDGSAVVTLDADARTRIALATEPAKALTMAHEREAYGRVLDPVSLIAAVAEEAAARTNVETAAKELRRVQTLAKDQNTSARTVEAADAALKQAQIALDAAHAKLLVAWGAGLAGREDLPDLVHALAVGNAALVRVELGAGDATLPVGVRLVTLDSKTVADAELLGSAPTVDPQTQGLGFLVLVHPNDARLLPGAAVMAYLQSGGEPESGVEIPRSAVVRSEGQAWAYVRVAPERFTRRALALERPTEHGWFVSSGVAPGDEIVVAGAQTLLSEELKSTVREED